MRKETPQIYVAELARVQGQLENSIESARSRARIPKETVSLLPTLELEDKMRWWRIWVVSSHSLANKTWYGGKTAEYLREARDVILTYYENGFVREASVNMKQDAEGHEYQMASEMARDKGKHWFQLASLTGNSLYLDMAAQTFWQAANLAAEGTSARALATMEEWIVNRKRGKKGNFNQFFETYLTVASLAPQAGGYDRQAAVSWWAVQEALRVGQLTPAKLAFEILQDATQKLGIPWWKKYLVGDAIKKGLEISRRATFRCNPKSLEL